MTEEHQRVEQHHAYGEEERVPEHSGTNHSMAIGFYIAAVVLIYGVTMVVVVLLFPAAPREGDLGFNVSFWLTLLLRSSGAGMSDVLNPPALCLKADIAGVVQLH